MDKLLCVIPSPSTVCVLFPTATLEHFMSIWLLFFHVVWWPRRFKISLWHVRCVQYIIDALTYWIAQPHAVNVSILWSAVIRSNGVRVSGQAVTREYARTGVNAHAHTDAGLPPIPGYCLDKMVYPRAICSALYTWLGMYWVTSLLVLESAAYFRLTRGICCRVCRFGDSVIIPQNPPKFGKLKGKCSPVRWSLLRLSLEPLEKHWAVSEHRQILGKSKPVCAFTDRAAAFIFISKLSSVNTWCDACKEQQMPKHTGDIRCALKTGPACLISTEPTWKNRCLKKKSHHYYPLLLFHLVERSVCHWCSLNLTFLYCLP